MMLYDLREDQWERIKTSLLCKGCLRRGRQ